MTDKVREIKTLNEDNLVSVLAGLIRNTQGGAAVDVNPEQFRAECEFLARRYITELMREIKPVTDQVNLAKHEAHRMAALLEQMESEQGFDSEPTVDHYYDYKDNQFLRPGARARHYGQDAVVVDGDWLIAQLEQRDAAVEALAKAGLSV